MDKHLVSVIMPAYNAGLYIANSIQSVIAQTYPYWELIIIDDGSTDATAGIAGKFAAVNPKIKYIYQTNGRQGKARNAGIKLSKGPYIAFLDADDLWTEDKLAVQMELLHKSEGIDLLFSNGYELIEDTATHSNVNIKQVWDLSNLPDFLHHNQIPILSVLMKKDAFIKAGGFTEKPEIQNAEDYHLWMKLLVAGCRFQSVPQRLFYYRIHAHQATFQNSNVSSPVFNAYIDLYKYATDRVVKKTIISYLKWYLFKKDFHQQCIDLFALHFHYKGLRALSFATKKLFSAATPIPERIVFNMVKIWG